MAASYVLSVFTRIPGAAKQLASNTIIAYTVKAVAAGFLVLVGV
jgi:hypothetical protein